MIIYSRVYPSPLGLQVERLLRELRDPPGARHLSSICDILVMAPVATLVQDYQTSCAKVNPCYCQRSFVIF